MGNRPGVKENHEIRQEGLTSEHKEHETLSMLFPRALDIGKT